MALIKLTVTPAKLAANRANGRKSRGPRTSRGKGFVTLNSLKHGRTASPKLFRTLLLRTGQDATLYDWFYRQICDFLPPGNRAEWADRERLARETYCWFRASNPPRPGPGLPVRQAERPVRGADERSPTRRDPRNRGFLGPKDWFQGARKYASRSTVLLSSKNPHGAAR